MLDNKLKKLEEIIKGYGQMLVALSGGVDSTFLLAFASKVFSEEGRADAVAALTATGPQFAEDEQLYAEQLCDRLGIAHKKVDVSHIIGMIKRNPIDRCYHCKREMFGILKERADMVGSVLCDGTNTDDMSDYRPGNRAIEELGIASPLKEAGLGKEEIREALKRLDTGDVREMAEKPALACLATRIPYGETITEQKLKAIDEAERFLRNKGFSQLRVRCHEIAGKVSGNETRFMARIETLSEEAGRMLEIKDSVEDKLKSLGFEFVTLDLGGYEKGKMNSMIEGMNVPDRIKVSETVVRGNAANVKTADVMAEIDRFLKETREQDYSFSDFVDIIEKLRQPDGCPWDREQTHESLKKHMVEEANEALDAIDEKNWNHLCEELGDVLLQIVLHSQIAAEAGEFTIDDVVQCVSEKMIRRHPHVFGNIDVSSVDEGLDLWEEIKKREKTATK
ncbi:MAG: ATP-dependent sacrificial sulfur transferase LarE [Bacillota bacterium]|nr:ATP-dependent sacrificial sulfur transferase LarE [Bacillota bacterium]